MSTYDSNVFDIGIFDTVVTDSTPVVFKLCVLSQYHFVTGEQTIPIIVYLSTSSTSAGRSFLANPLLEVFIDIYGPGGNILITTDPMERIDIGVYLYNFKLNKTTIGVYTAQLLAQHISLARISKRFFICQSKPQSYN